MVKVHHKSALHMIKVHHKSVRHMVQCITDLYYT